MFAMQKLALHSVAINDVSNYSTLSCTNINVNNS